MIFSEHGRMRVTTVDHWDESIFISDEFLALYLQAYPNLLTGEGLKFVVANGWALYRLGMHDDARCGHDAYLLKSDWEPERGERYWQ